MTDAENDAIRISQWIGEQYGLIPVSSIGKTEILQVIAAAEQRGREEVATLLKAKDILKDPKRYGEVIREGYKRGLLRAVKIAKGPFSLQVLNDAGDIISNLIKKEANEEATL